MLTSKMKCLQSPVIIVLLAASLLSTKAQVDFCCLCKNCAQPLHSNDPIDMGEGMTCGDLDILMPSYGEYAGSPTCQQLQTGYSSGCCSSADAISPDDYSGQILEEEDTTSVSIVTTRRASGSCCLCDNCRAPVNPNSPVQLGARQMTCSVLAATMPSWNLDPESDTCKTFHEEYTPGCCEMAGGFTNPGNPRQGVDPNFGETTYGSPTCCLCENCESPMNSYSTVKLGQREMTCSELASAMPSWKLESDSDDCKTFHEQYTPTCCRQFSQGRDPLNPDDPTFGETNIDPNACCLCEGCASVRQPNLPTNFKGMSCGQLSASLPHWAITARSSTCEHFQSSYKASCCSSIPGQVQYPGPVEVPQQTGICCLCGNCREPSRPTLPLEVSGGSTTCSQLAADMPSWNVDANSPACQHFTNKYSTPCCTNDPFFPTYPQVPQVPQDPIFGETNLGGGACCLCAGCASPMQPNRPTAFADGMTCGQLALSMPKWSFTASNPACQHIQQGYSSICCTNDPSFPTYPQVPQVPQAPQPPQDPIFGETNLGGSACCLCAGCASPMQPNRPTTFADGMTCGQLALSMPKWALTASSPACQQIQQGYNSICCI